MKIFYSPASPFVRKVMIVAHELGLADRIERLPSAAHPVNRDQRIIPSNPLGKVPTLVLDDGTCLYDSRVICEYLDNLAGQSGIFPAAGIARWIALRDQALADGLLDAGLLVRYEIAVRPEPLRWQDWTDGQMDKIICSLKVMESNAHSYDGRLDIGTISLASALGFLDFRFPDFDWRRDFSRAGQWFAQFSLRPSVQATMPVLPGAR